MLPCPKNISIMWSFGSLLGLVLVRQILSGIFLAIYHTSNINIAFDSSIYISRDVINGWLIRRLHANGATSFFILIYIHIGRGLYYVSYTKKIVWTVGVTLFFISILTAFLGYVLPWGQISYWAATVITNLISAIPYLGSSIVIWIWGGFSVMNATLARFFVFHFIFPFIIIVLSLVHLFFLHNTGSSNPLGVNSTLDLIPFHNYFRVKDLAGLFFFWVLLGTTVLLAPNILTDPENFIPANSLVTPTHIQPEWYFLPMYAILRSVPNKLGGVIALIIRVAVLYLIPLIKSNIIRSHRQKFRLFWIFIITFLVLMWIGRKPVEAPYDNMGIIFSLLYFIYFFF